MSVNRIESEPERAQLWAVYFGLLALPQLPPFLHEAMVQLDGYLHEEPVAATPQAGAALRRVK
jgi:hypothetical protein